MNPNGHGIRRMGQAPLQNARLALELNRAKRPFKPVRKTVTIIVPPCFWVIWWDDTPAAVYTLECLGMGMPVELFAGAGLVSHIWVGTKIRQQPNK